MGRQRVAIYLRQAFKKVLEVVVPVLVVARPRGSRKLGDTILDNTRPKRVERLSESSGFNDETDTSCSGGYLSTN